MKKIFTLFFCGLLSAFLLSTAHAQLVSGDIAVIGINTDDPDGFQIITLVDIPANTSVTFTDNAWVEGAGFNSNEGYLTWTTPNSVISKGSTFVFTQGTSNWGSGATISPNVGTISAVGPSVNSLAFSTSGDQIIAFTGAWPDRPTVSNSTNFLWALSTRNFTYATGSSASNTSDLPSALSSYSLSFTGTTTDIDNGYFANGNTATTSVTYAGTKGDLITLLTDRTKYYTNNTGPLTFPSSAIILPLQLLSFSATPKENTVAFSWKTVNERNTHHFEIEQSLDGINFKSFATVAAAGNPTTERSYSYTGSLNNTVTYYRLKTVDADGKSATSSVVKVAPSKTGFSLGNVYPVPTKNNLTVEWNSKTAGATSLILTDMSGRTVRTLNLQSAQGFNQYQLDINTLTSGQYFLRLKNDMNQVQTIITKQ